MFFLFNVIVVIRAAFKGKQKRTETEDEKYKLAKRELSVIAKLGVLMGNIFLNT